MIEFHHLFTFSWEIDLQVHLSLIDHSLLPYFSLVTFACEKKMRKLLILSAAFLVTFVTGLDQQQHQEIYLTCDQSLPDVEQEVTLKYADFTISRVDSFKLQILMYDPTQVYLNETRITNYDDIITGYFLAKIFELPEEPRNKLEMQIIEVLRVVQRTFTLLGAANKNNFELPRTTNYPGDVLACSTTCDGPRSLCFRLKHL